MKDSENDLKRIIVDVVNDNGCQLYHVENSAGKLEILVDKKGGTTIADCEKISRELLLRFRSIDRLRNIHLEVSSPGIERRLYKKEHYRSAIGERVSVKTKGEDIVGVLTKVDEADIEIRFESGVGRRITYNEILSTQVKRSTEELFKRRK
jgi:ribosome maturation factor RimP